MDVRSRVLPLQAQNVCPTVNCCNTCKSSPTSEKLLGLPQGKATCSGNIAAWKSGGLGFYASTTCRQGNIFQEACHIVIPVMLSSQLAACVKLYRLPCLCQHVGSCVTVDHKVQDLLAEVMCSDMSWLMCAYTAST